MNNPLNPSYQLPKVEMKPATPPKFIRDNLTNEDIEGAKPKKQKHYETRESILVSLSKNLVNFRKLEIFQEPSQEIELSKEEINLMQLTTETSPMTNSGLKGAQIHLIHHM